MVRQFTGKLAVEPESKVIEVSLKMQLKHMTVSSQLNSIGIVRFI